MHKAKSLAIAGTLVGGMTLAGQASAAIVSNNNTEGFENEFFISIVNNVTQQNIGVDLNYTTEDFLNGVVFGGLSATDQAAVQSFLATGAMSDFEFNLASSQQSLFGPVNFAVYTSAAGGGKASNNQAMQNMWNLINTYALEFNTNPIDGFETENVRVLNNHLAGGWGNGIGASTGFSNEGALDQVLNIVRLGITLDTYEGIVEIVGTVSVGSDGQISLIPASAIPLPPAVWMLGSALVGLAGVARRRAAA